MKSIFSLLRGRAFLEPSQHERTPPPSMPKVKYVASPDVLIGRILIGLQVASWSSAWCNNSMFIYELDDGDCMMFPNFVRNCNFECWCVEGNDSFRSLNQIGYSEIADNRLFGCRIIDVLVPTRPEDRVPDSQVVLLSSGYCVSQESGAPIGILPGLFLSQPVLSCLTSLRTHGSSKPSHSSDIPVNERKS